MNKSSDLMRWTWKEFSRQIVVTSKIARFVPESYVKLSQAGMCIVFIMKSWLTMTIL